MDLVAAGVPASTVAPKIRERERELAAINLQRQTPRRVPTDLDALRTALTLRATEWRDTPRSEPQIARLLLRRLIGPLTLWNSVEPSDEWVQWEANTTTELLAGLVPPSSIHLVASPTGFDPVALVLGGKRFRVSVFPWLHCQRGSSNALFRRRRLSSTPSSPAVPPSPGIAPAARYVRAARAFRAARIPCTAPAR